MRTRSRSSANYKLVYQGDGNLVLYNTSNWSAVWNSQTSSTAGMTCMQGDGNLVVYAQGGAALWSSGTYGNNGAYLVVDPAGAIVIRRSNDTSFWGRPFLPGGPPPPPPPSSATVVLVNGTFVNPNDSWIQPGTAEYNAIASTYGVAPDPFPWTSNSLYDVLPPQYSGIVNGGYQLAQYINALPAGEVTVISHSHGGNVVLMSRLWSNRPLRNIVQFATPVNWDFWDYRWVFGYGVAKRCQVSSTADWVQFLGSSPYQIDNFAYSVYYSMVEAYQAYEALRDGDYETAMAYFGVSVYDALVADYWLDTTRIELEGPTYLYGGLGHSELHEPPVWNQMSGPCR